MGNVKVATDFVGFVEYCFAAKVSEYMRRNGLLYLTKEQFVEQANKLKSEATSQIFKRVAVNAICWDKWSKTDATRVCVDTDGELGVEAVRYIEFDHVAYI